MGGTRPHLFFTEFQRCFFFGGLVALVVISKSILEDVPGRGVIFWRWHVWVLSWIPFSELKNAVSGLATGFHGWFLQFSCAQSFSFFVNVEDLEEAALDQKRPVQLEVRAQFEVWAGKIVLLQPGGFGRWLFKKASSNPSTEAANSYFGSVVSSFKCFPTDRKSVV